MTIIKEHQFSSRGQAQASSAPGLLAQRDFGRAWGKQKRDLMQEA